MLYKRYITVIELHDLKGQVTPIQVLWDSINGSKAYRIDKILSVRKAASVVGGCGIRYECLIKGEKRNLFFEKDRWFIESQKP